MYKTPEQKKREAKERAKAKRIWLLSFFRVIAFRYLLTPIGTIQRHYHSPDVILSYKDVYVFGVRVARFHILIPVE